MCIYTFFLDSKRLFFSYSHRSIRMGPLAVAVAVVRAEVAVDTALLQAPTRLPLAAGHRRALKARIQPRLQWDLFDATITMNAIGTPHILHWRIHSLELDQQVFGWQKSIMNELFTF